MAKKAHLDPRHHLTKREIAAANKAFQQDVQSYRSGKGNRHYGSRQRQMTPRRQPSIDLSEVRSVFLFVLFVLIVCGNKMLQWEKTCVYISVQVVVFNTMCHPEIIKMSA